MFYIKIAYIRVSSKDQSTLRQIAAIDQIGGVDKIYEEKKSGKNMDRPALNEMLNFIRDGDTLYIESISRLGRNLKDLLEIIDLLNSKNVGIISLKESHINTTTPEGKLIFNIFASLSEFERECSRHRQREGIEIAKLEGKYRGRKKIKLNEDKFKQIYKMWKSNEITATKAMNLLDIKKNTFYRRVKELEGCVK